MHANEVIWHKENGGNARGTSNRGSIIRKGIRKEFTGGGRFSFFLGSGVRLVKTLRTNMQQIF